MKGEVGEGGEYKALQSSYVDCHWYCLAGWVGHLCLFVQVFVRVVTINSKTIPKDIQHGVDTISVHIRISTRAVLATTAMIKVCKFNYNHPPFPVTL